MYVKTWTWLFHFESFSFIIHSWKNGGVIMMLASGAIETKEKLNLTYDVVDYLKRN